MTNRLIHTVTVDQRISVDTVAQLIAALGSMSPNTDDYLDKTYVVELLLEELSDKSKVYSISIREAEPI
jgi:hypothetical protein